MHWLFFFHVGTDHDGGGKFLERCKKYCGAARVVNEAKNARIF